MNRSSRSLSCVVPLALTWSHDGAAFRITPWPEATIERRYGDEWIPVRATAEVFTAGSSSVAGRAWRAYLEFVPVAAREFLERFQANRIPALQFAARCPDIVGALTEIPALAAFAFHHAALRGGETPRWDELNAVFERGGLFAVLEWLGLPASRQTLSVLRNLITADVPFTLLPALRTVLWKPEGVFALAGLPSIGVRELRDACALAA